MFTGALIRIEDFAHQKPAFAMSGAGFHADVNYL
jgi:hypothetical protein